MGIGKPDAFLSDPVDIQILQVGISRTTRMVKAQLVEHVEQNVHGNFLHCFFGPDKAGPKYFLSKRFTQASA